MSGPSIHDDAGLAADIAGHADVAGDEIVSNPHPLAALERLAVGRIRPAAALGCDSANPPPAIASSSALGVTPFSTSSVAMAVITRS